MVLGFNLLTDCVEFGCSVRVCVGFPYLSFFLKSKDMQFKLIGDSKLPIGVNVFSVSMCQPRD